MHSSRPLLAVSLLCLPGVLVAEDEGKIAGLIRQDHIRNSRGEPSPVQGPGQASMAGAEAS